MPTPVDDQCLHRIAFGDRPGEPVPPARPGDTPYSRWLRAVALGAQGWYASARVVLDSVLVSVPSHHPVHALALATRASLLRQLGDHAAAAPLDGRAFVAVSSTPRGPVDRAARCDALTGLAADALGCGRLELADRLLARTQAELTVDLGPRDGLARARIRLHWVRAEVALARGQFGSAAEDAATALGAAREFGSVRHVAKSRLLAAAALTGTSHAAAASAGEEVLELCDEHHLMPLAWAAAMLVAGVSSDTARAARAERMRRDYERVLARRGGRFRR
ncbi:hypothetical protein [Rhodococcus sp. HNM0569]|uniref:hypothetical protein n=1 Tax=Rhodococcus sp. HNM0569 TaxID=2716340 RepID=UPI003211D602